MSNAAPSSTPPDDSLRRGDPIMRWFMTVLILGLAGAAVFCAVVFNNVRDTAADTDRCLRLVAWRSLLYAETHDGAYPDGPEALEAVEVATRLAHPAEAGSEQHWPATLAEALGEQADGMALDALLAMAAERVEIGFDPSGQEPPHLSGRGYPSTHGVIEEVNDWLYAQYAASRRRDG